MPQPVTVYRWDDVGAPQIGSANSAEIYNILKKCLVEGYGSKISLGWSLLGEDVNNKIAFKNAASGGCFEMEANDIAPFDKDTLFLITPCQNWLAFGTHDKPGYQKGFQVSDTSSYSAWVLIGTSSGFYFLTGKINSTSIASSMTNATEQVIFVGDIKSYYQNDPAKFIAYSGGQGKDYTWSSRWGGLAHTKAFDYSIGLPGGYGDSLVKVYNMDGSNSFDDMIVRVSRAFRTRTEPPISSNCDVYLPVQLLKEEAKNGWLRGELPGLLYATTAIHAQETWPFISKINNIDYWPLRPNAQAVNLYINTVAW